MGMSSPAPVYYTADMVRELNEAEPRFWPRYECVYGELLVSPAPRMLHERVTMRIAFELATYVKREPVGEVMRSPADISWGRPDVLAQPDVFVIPPGIPSAPGWIGVRHVLLAVETLSPSTANHDRFTKRKLYQNQGVPLYWILDADDAHAEVWTPADEFPRFEREQLVWHPDGALTPFVLPLAELFRDA
jgi:Uma2 family endonuclease